MRSALITIAVLVLTPLLLRALLGWLRRRFPVAPGGPGDRANERLAAAYRRLVRRALLGWLLLAGGLTALFLHLLAAAAAGREARLARAEFAFVPDWPFWILPALLLALVAAALLIEGILRLALGSRFSAFARYDELQHGFGRRGTTVVYAAVALPCLLFSVALWDHYAVADADGLRLNGFWSLQERHCP